MSVNISVNRLIKWEDEDGMGVTERVLWVDEGGIISYTIDVWSKNALPTLRTIAELTEAIETGIAVMLDDDPTARIVAEDKISGRDKKIREQAWSIISSLVEDDDPAIYRREKRGPLAEKTAEEFKVTKKTVYFYLRRYWQRSQTKNALLPDYGKSGGRGKSKVVGEKKRGRPRKRPEIRGNGINVDEETKRIFRNAIKLYYNNRRENPLTVAYTSMLRDFYGLEIKLVNGIEVPVLKPADLIPTPEQFEYWFEKEKDVKKTTIARKGRKDYEINLRPLLRSSNAERRIGPGHFYQIDATVADVYLVSSYNRQWIIGRPVIYVLIDVFSRMIVGVYVGLEGPSWLGAMMALTNAGTDKVKFCKEYGIEISEEEWPCKYMPKIIIADRGEMLSDNSDSLVDSLDVRVRIASAYRADWKGIVERHFRTIHEKVKPFTPGYVIEDLKKRGGKDYRQDAKLTIYEFTRIILLCILHHNSHYLATYNRDEMMIEDDVEPIPIKLWHWGIVNRSGRLKYYTEDYIKLSLMPRDSARVTRKGIIFKSMVYSCGRAIREQWFDRAFKDTWQVDVSYDPRNMNSVYIRDIEEQGKYDKCHLWKGQGKYRGRTMDEINYLLDYEELLRQKSSYAGLQSEAELSAQIDAIVDEGERMSNEAGDGAESKASRVKGIRNHRQKEREQMREKEAFELGESVDTTPEIQAADGSSEQPKTANPGRMRMLRKKQEERSHG